MSQIIASIIGSIGFSIVFGIRRAYMLPIAVNAGLSWAVYLLVNGFAGDFAANMVSAMFCSLVAALMARRLRVPTPRQNMGTPRSGLARCGTGNAACIR